MKKMKRFSIFLLLGILIFSLFFSACGTEIPHNENPNAYQPTQDAYEDNMVNVCIKPEYSEVNKPWYAEDFNLKGIKIEKIVDRKYREDPSAYPPVSSNWSQVLELTLSKHSKENVINAIHQIEVLYFVEWAIPEYIYSHSDTYVPNDTNYSLQWGLNNLDGASIENVWNFTMGDASPRIKVGIFENNVQSNHPDLRVINGPYSVFRIYKSVSP